MDSNTRFPFRAMMPPSERRVIASAAFLSLYEEPTFVSSPDWDTFASNLQVSTHEALTPVANDWRYVENFCVFEKNKSIYLINNKKSYPRKKYPTEFYSWYYKRYIYFRNNSLTSFPAGMTLLDNVYFFINRGWGGWNNIYHHTEWVNNLLRYVHHASELPRVVVSSVVNTRWRMLSTIRT